MFLIMTYDLWLDYDVSLIYFIWFEDGWNSRIGLVLKIINMLIESNRSDEGFNKQ